jgi:hypothetical protein
VNLRTRKKLSRSKRKCRRHFQFHYREKKKDAENSNTSGVQKHAITLSRGRYYKKFRRERCVLKILSNTLPDLNSFSRDSRRIARNVYYRILPYLKQCFKYHNNDTAILLDLEAFYYDLLNRMNHNRGTRTRANRLWFGLSNLTPTVVTTVPSKSSIEPVLRQRIQSGTASAPTDLESNVN